MIVGVVVPVLVGSAVVVPTQERGDRGHQQDAQGERQHHGDHATLPHLAVELGDEVRAGHVEEPARGQRDQRGGAGGRHAATARPGA